ncbi:MAG TPA: prolipoprotein diacylglyceryl transferase family protein, partial [Gemmatimonadaceae bacterium]|nr:prolipoprotein diacylglyceryl transferase family protein [Gemmatimonadaceae bacterium]
SWLGLVLPNERRVWCRRVPSQLLECSLAAGLFFGAMFWTERPFDGALFLTALAIYAAARVPLGATRDTVDRVKGVNVLTAISLLLLLVAVTIVAIVIFSKGAPTS